MWKLGIRNYRNKHDVYDIRVINTNDEFNAREDYTSRNNIKNACY